MDIKNITIIRNKLNWDRTVPQPPDPVDWKGTTSLWRYCRLLYCCYILYCYILLRHSGTVIKLLGKFRLKDTQVSLFKLRYNYIIFYFPFIPSIYSHCTLFARNWTHEWVISIKSILSGLRELCRRGGGKNVNL